MKKKKKLLLFMWTLLTTLGFSQRAVADDATWIDVSTVEELTQVLTSSENTTANIRLTADIDLSAFNNNMFCPESQAFAGILDGNGHRLMNYTHETANINYVGLFSYANNATFKNLTLYNCHLTQASSDGNGFYKGLLVGHSENCQYIDISVRNSSIPLGSKKFRQQRVGGLVGISTNDTFTSCTTTSDCRLEGYVSGDGSFSRVGGIAGEAFGSTFTFCNNGATVWGDGRHEGGIVGFAQGCTIDRCLNTGAIYGYALVGGIVGDAENSSDGTIGSTITKCVNNGSIDTYDGDHGTYEGNNLAGIVGYLYGDKCSAGQCLNLGNISNASDCSGTIIGSYYQATVGGGSMWYCTYNGTYSESAIYDITGKSYTKEEVLSGKFACEVDYLYQTIDVEATSMTYPVPIPAAGKVYENFLCHNQSKTTYSNIFHGKSGHTDTNVSKWGFCTKCGLLLPWPTGEAPSTIDISNPTDLSYLNYGLLQGRYENPTFNLTNDIDMTGVTDFIPIGASKENSFNGTFNGNGHRIKNLTLKREGVTGVGFFGVVAGTATIQDLIIDKSCVIDGNYGLGTAGLVGCINSDGTDKNTLTISHCANEATVKGCENVAGLLGGVYNDNSYVYINDCYNSGNIEGEKVSAALVANGKQHFTISRCLNTGTVTGYIANDYAIHTSATDLSGVSVSNCYQPETLGADDMVTAKTATELASGNVCAELNNTTFVWGQILGKDATPNFSNGIRYERAMSDTWGTAILPYSLKQKDNEEVELYKVSSKSNMPESEESTGKIILEAVDNVDANTPFFFKKVNELADSVHFSKASVFKGYSEETVSLTNADNSWVLTGTYSQKAALKDVFFVNHNQLLYADNGETYTSATIMPFCAYMTYEDGPITCKTFNIVTDGSTDYVNVMLNAYGYGTFSSSHDVEIESGCNAYTVEFVDDELLCTKIDDRKIPAYTGVLLYGKPVSTVTMAIIDDVPALKYNDMKPTTTSTGLAEKEESYTLSGDTFKKFTGTSYNPDKAYLPMSAYKGSSANAKFTIVFDDTLPTAITTVSHQSSAVKIDGKYISDGKLIIIRNSKKYNTNGIEIK